VNLEISPQPGEAEKAAILAALEAEEAEHTGPSPWARAVLPRREAEEPEQP
jgi:hypothetical protein